VIDGIYSVSDSFIYKYFIIPAWYQTSLCQQWIMPSTVISTPAEIFCKEVCNFPLDLGHTILVTKVAWATLDHGFGEDVVRHYYYVTERVIKDLRRLDARKNNSGMIEITEETLIRNEQTWLSQ
jgi:hypothetical protein